MKFLLMLALLMALPPLSPPEREKQAVIIATGTVVSQTEKIETVDKGTNTVYTVQFAPDRTLKGKAPSNLTFTYWRTGKRPQGWAGPQGQNSALSKGQKATVFLQGDEKGYRLLEPNGWDAVR